MKLRRCDQKQWHSSLEMIALSCLLIALAVLAPTALANGSVTEWRESTSVVVPLVILVLGGVVALLGVYIVFRRQRGSSDVTIQIGPTVIIRMSRLTQGVLVVLLGVIVLIVGLLNVPRTTTKRDIQGKVIRFDKDGAAEEAKE